MAGPFWWIWQRRFRREREERELLDPHDSSRRVRFRFVNVQCTVRLVVRHRIIGRRTQGIDSADMHGSCRSRLHDGMCISTVGAHIQVLRVDERIHFNTVPSRGRIEGRDFRRRGGNVRSGHTINTFAASPVARNVEVLVVHGETYAVIDVGRSSQKNRRRRVVRGHGIKIRRPAGATRHHENARSVRRQSIGG